MLKLLSKRWWNRSLISCRRVITAAGCWDRVADEVALQFPLLAESVLTHIQQQVDVRAVVTEKWMPYH